ncbi:MAG: hypothetical protein AAF958_02360 [Planctomycetota bacterium]
MKTLPLIEPIDPAMVGALQAKSEAERLRVAWGMWKSARAMLVRMLTQENPAWTAEQVNAEVARRLGSGG